LASAVSCSLWATASAAFLLASAAAASAAFLLSSASASFFRTANLFRAILSRARACSLAASISLLTSAAAASFRPATVDPVCLVCLVCLPACLGLFYPSTHSFTFMHAHTYPSAPIIVTLNLPLQYTFD